MLGPMRSVETTVVRAVQVRSAKGRWAVVAAVLLSLVVAASASGSYVQQTTLAPNNEIGTNVLGDCTRGSEAVNPPLCASALSSDGNIALVGGPGDNGGKGAAWIFVRRGASWTEQAKLTARGEIGHGQFGAGVALSSDGKTALIGGPEDSGSGAAWIFTRAGSDWKQRGPKLTGKDAGGAGQESHCDRIGGEYVEGTGTYCFVGHPADFGESVALSSDGNTALIGGPGDNENDGAAWVFTRSGSAWTPHGEKLVGGGEQNEFRYDGGYRAVRGGGRFGDSVALSSDGGRALIGGPQDDTEYYEGGYDRSGGAAWVFARSGSTWRQQGEKLVGAVGLGGATALSADGNIALIGSSPVEFNGSNAEVFTRSGSTWIQQAQLGQGYEHAAKGVALSSDGTTALISGLSSTAEGFEPKPLPATRVFGSSGATWIEQPPPLEVPRGTCGFTRLTPFGNTGACGVALSGDGSTALFGTTVYVDRLEAPSR